MKEDTMFTHNIIKLLYQEQLSNKIKQQKKVSAEDSSFTSGMVASVGPGNNQPRPLKSRAFGYKHGAWSHSIVKGKNLITSWNTNSLFDSRLNSEGKEGHPMLNLLSNGRLALVCLDFDKLHQAKATFGSCVEDWADVRNRILNVYCGDACVLPSVSGKAKALFLVNGVLTAADAKAWILENIEPALIRCLDLTDAALIKCFVNSYMTKRINTWLSSNPKIFYFDGSKTNVYIHDILYSQPTIETEYIIGKNEWVDYKDALPNLKVSRTALHIIRFLLGNPYLAITKVGLTQDWLAERYGVSQQTISKAIIHLIKKGYLRILSRHYQGICSARYQVAGTLLEVCKDKYFERCGKTWKKPIELLSTLPRTIEDGLWSNTIMANTKWFSDSEQFMEWVSAIPGFNQNDREQKSISIWNAHARNNGYDELT